MSRPAFKPTKHVPDGSTKAVIGKLFAECGGAKEVAFLLDVSMSRAYQLAEDGSLSLDQAARLTFASGSTVAAEYLAALCGGTFTPGTATGDTLRESLARVAREAGDVFAQMTEADDAGALAAELDDLIRAATAARSKIAPVAKAVRG